MSVLMDPTTAHEITLLTYISSLSSGTRSLEADGRAVKPSPPWARLTRQGAGGRIAPDQYTGHGRHLGIVRRCALLDVHTGP